MKTLFLIICLVFIFNSNISFGQSGWIQQSVNTTRSLNNVQFINNTTGWIVGDSGIICSTTNGGTNWLKSTYSTSSEILRSIYFKNQNTGIIGGCTGGNNAGYVLRTSDGGLNWSQTSFAGVPYDFFSFGGDTVWSSRHNGTVMKSTNMGLNWTTTNVRNSLELYTVYFVNNMTGWTGGAVFGEYTYLYKTTNGGNSWFLQFIHLTDHIYSLYFINNLTGFASTLRGSVYETTNGGNDWITKLAGSNEILFEIRFPDANTGYTVGANKRILKTTNQGVSWNLQALPPNIPSSVSFTSVNFRDVNTGWVIGNNGIILKTTNGGITGLENIGSTVPNVYTLSQNYPNPFNPTTSIEFDLPQNGFTTLIVYDLTGRIVETLVNQDLARGSYKVTVDGSKLSSGVYYYKLSSGDFFNTKKFVLVK